MIGVNVLKGTNERAKSHTRAHSRIKDRSTDVSNDKFNIVEPFVGEYVSKYGIPNSFVPSSANQYDESSYTLV